MSKYQDLFKDKVYDELDDISQLVEPFEFELNNQLAQMPDEINLDAEFFKAMVSYHNGGSSFYEALRQVVKREAHKLDLKELGDHARLNRDFTKDFFEFVIDEDLQYNAATNELNGEAKIIKKRNAFEDKEIEEMLIDYMRDEFNSRLSRPSNISKPRINEICDLFGIDEALKDRKARGKVNKLYNRYKELMADRRLNIRDVDLFKRFIDWNVRYIVDGSLPSMSNITKIKIMMRSELPIYSIKEEEV